jgi:hypothetical protein
VWICHTQLAIAHNKSAIKGQAAQGLIGFTRREKRIVSELYQTAPVRNDLDAAGEIKKKTNADLILEVNALRGPSVAQEKEIATRAGAGVPEMQALQLLTSKEMRGLIFLGGSSLHDPLPGAQPAGSAQWYLKNMISDETARVERMFADAASGKPVAEELKTTFANEGLENLYERRLQIAKSGDTQLSKNAISCGSSQTFYGI